MDIVCVSHLRWDFVFQRPQHLLTRAAAGRRVFYVEEPIFGEGTPALQVRTVTGGVIVLVPRLPLTATPEEQLEQQEMLLGEFLNEQAVSEFALWYYTPMALMFTRRLSPAVVVYDCMDELTGFAGAPPRLAELESELLRDADVVFTGGRSLFEAKRTQHQNIHCYPSSVDVKHFEAARTTSNEPVEQASIPHPRLGYYGVIDERIDYDLLRQVAAARPDWHIVLVGPTAKVNPDDLPAASNLHYLGGRPYSELPSYIAGWDVALMPFARNDATRYISPTKTPEYLAAGKPIVSTSIHDVVHPYGERGLAAIADTPEEFVAAVEQLLGEPDGARQQRQNAADAFLAGGSWDRTWDGMRDLIEQAANRRATHV
jgi:glycosyltransferase involved in cell wall biosynthesis